MKNPLTAIITNSRKLFLAVNNKPKKSAYHLSIEKKWWMGEDLFADQKPLTTNTLKNKRISG